MAQNPADPSPAPSAFSLHCPKDGAPMKKVPAGEGALKVNVDKCTACGAFWFDATELQRVLHNKDAARTLDPTTGHYRHKGRPEPKDACCPRDGARLIEVVDQKQPHVHMLSCTVCGGVLLDPGEVRDLAHFNGIERLKGFFA
jgi:Zn-finger nucleic acid-binding protein